MQHTTDQFNKSNMAPTGVEVSSIIPAKTAPGTKGRTVTLKTNMWELQLPTNTPPLSIRRVSQGNHKRRTREDQRTGWRRQERVGYCSIYLGLRNLSVNCSFLQVCYHVFYRLTETNKEFEKFFAFTYDKAKILYSLQELGTLKNPYSVNLDEGERQLLRLEDKVTSFEVTVQQCDQDFVCNIGKFVAAIDGNLRKKDRSMLELATSQGIYYNLSHLSYGNTHLARNAVEVNDRQLGRDRQTIRGISNNNAASVMLVELREGLETPEKALIMEKQKFQAVNNELENARKRAENAEKYVSDLVRILEETKKKHRKTLAQLSQRVDELENALRMQMRLAELARTEKEAELEAKVADFETQLAEAEKRRKSLAHELQTMKDTHSETVAQLNAQIDQLQTKPQCASAATETELDVASLESCVCELICQNDTLTTAQKTMQKTIRTLESAIEQLKIPPICADAGTETEANEPQLEPENDDVYAEETRERVQKLCDEQSQCTDSDEKLVQRSLFERLKRKYISENRPVPGCLKELSEESQRAEATELEQSRSLGGADGSDSSISLGPINVALRKTNCDIPTKSVAVITSDGLMIQTEKNVKDVQKEHGPMEVGEEVDTTPGRKRRVEVPVPDPSEEQPPEKVQIIESTVEMQDDWAVDERMKKLLVALQRHWLSEYKNSREKLLVEITEKLHQQFLSDQQKIRTELLAQFKDEFDATREELEHKYRETLKQEQQNLNEKHRWEITNAKKKQWCWQCEAEAIYHCCWNTAYCSIECQQAHWSTHRKFCRRKKGGCP